MAERRSSLLGRGALVVMMARRRFFLRQLDMPDTEARTIGATIPSGDSPSVPAGQIGTKSYRLATAGPTRSRLTDEDQARSAVVSDRRGLLAIGVGASIIVIVGSVLRFVLNLLR